MPWLASLTNRDVRRRVMEASLARGTRGLGTVNLARRAWKQPLREHGFVLSGHQGPSLTCLRQLVVEE